MSPAEPQFVDDVRVPGTLWVKALRSPAHHADIKRLDNVSKAEAMEGVHAIITLGGRAAPRVWPPLRSRHPRRLAIAREGRGPLRGPADRGRRGRRRGRRRRPPVDAIELELAGEARPLRRPQGVRLGRAQGAITGATGIRTSRRRWIGARSARARSRRRSTRPT